MHLVPPPRRSASSRSRPCWPTGDHRDPRARAFLSKAPTAVVIALIDNYQLIRCILEYLGRWAPERTEHPPPLDPDAWPVHASLSLAYHPVPDIA